MFDAAELIAVDAEMLVTCDYSMFNSINGYNGGPGVTIYNITIQGVNETVSVLPPGSTFNWQQVYPITTADMYETYVNATVIASGYRARGTPYDLPVYSNQVSLPVKRVVDFKLTTAFQSPGGWHDSLRGDAAAFWLKVTADQPASRHCLGTSGFHRPAAARKPNL
jgi:hypothetical protein